MIFFQPVQGVVNKKLPHNLAVGPIEVDSITPRGLVLVGKKIRRVQMQIVTVRAEMVIHHVQQHHHFALDRKSTRLNSSHVALSYAVFCLRKKASTIRTTTGSHAAVEV